MKCWYPATAQHDITTQDLHCYENLKSCIEIHQFLVYVDVNLLGRNRSTMKKNTELLLDLVRGLV